MKPLSFGKLLKIQIFMVMAMTLNACGPQVSNTEKSIQNYQQLGTVLRTYPTHSTPGLILSPSQQKNLDQAVADASTQPTSQPTTQPSYPAEMTARFQNAWGVMKPEDFDQKVENSVLKQILKLHVAPRANGEWPNYTQLFTFLRNTQPAFQVMSAAFAKKIAVAHTLPIGKKQDVVWLDTKKTTALADQEIVLVSVADLSTALKDKPEFYTEYGKQEKLVYNAFRDQSFADSQLANIVRNGLIAFQAPPEPYATLAMLGGLLSGLDPHSYLIPTKENDARFAPSTSLVGIGAQIKTYTQLKKFQISHIIPGSPAEMAGLQAADYVVSVDGHATADIADVSKLVDLIKGIEGTQVQITVNRQGKEQTFIVTRKSVQMSTVEFDTNIGGSGVPKMRLSVFSKDVGKMVAAGASANGIEAKDFWILDLRDNLGGKLDAAIELLQFLGPNASVGANLFYFFTGKEFKMDFISNHLLENKVAKGPKNIVLLTNEHSASASELSAENLKHFGNTIIIGTRTYGKGSMQNIREIKDNVSMALTEGLYFVSDNDSPQFKGVTPTFDTMSLRKKFAEPGEVIEPQYESDFVGAIKPVKGNGEITPSPNTYPKTLACLNDLASSDQLVKGDDLSTPLGVDGGIEMLVAMKAINCARTAEEVKK